MTAVGEPTAPPGEARAGRARAGRARAGRARAGGAWAGRFRALRRNRRWPPAAVVAALLAQMAFAMVATATAQSPTIDEPVYIGTGVTYLRDHDLRYNPEHPPLG